MSAGLTLIVFDCDGTITDSGSTATTAMAQAFEVHNLTPPSLEAMRHTIGLSPIQAFESLFDGEPPVGADVLVQSFRDSYLRLVNDGTHKDPLFEGAQEAIQSISNVPEILLGIATGNSQRGVARLLNGSGLEKVFQTIQTADDAPSKPHPAMLHQAMDAIGIEANRTMMVGDTTFDMEMAVLAGVYPVGVAWGYHTVEMLTRAGAKYIATDYRDLENHMRAVHSSFD